MEKEKLQFFKDMILAMQTKEISDIDKRQEMLKKHEDLLQELDFKEGVKMFVAAFFASSKTEKPFDEEQNYRRVIDNLTKLAEEVCDKDALEYSNLFSYLLYNGYFSTNHELGYNIANRANLTGHYAYDIFNGNGVCLNYSDMLTDYLNNSGIPASTLSNKVKLTTIFDHFPGLYLERSKAEFKDIKKYLVLLPFILPICLVAPNHAVTLTDEKGIMLAYDPTNLTVHNVVDSKKMEVIGSDKTIKVFPYYSYSLNDSSNTQLLEKLISNGQSKEIPKDTLGNIAKAIWHLNYAKFCNNNALFEDFHDYIKEDIDVIAKRVQMEKEKPILKR